MINKKRTENNQQFGIANKVLLPFILEGTKYQDLVLHFKKRTILGPYLQFCRTEHIHSLPSTISLGMMALTS